MIHGAMHGLLLVQLQMGLLGLSPQATPQNQQAQPQTRPAAPAATQPTTQPSGRSSEQLEILSELLAEKERPTPVAPASGMQPRQRVSADGQNLIPDGSYLVERPARFLKDGDRAMVSLVISGDPNPRVLELLSNQMLEALEQEVERGYSEFIVSGEVTSYRGVNKLLLRKVLRRVSNGNLAP